ncbi:MAG TPA: hypothetical protein VFG32_08715 [Bacteroidota bacterium]|nr:hypothetical protein [Bacteroidota bacterium]
MVSSFRQRRIYLSGGMEYSADEGRDWRSSLQQWLEAELQCKVFNPNVESERYFAEHLPTGDFRALKASDPDTYRRLAEGLVVLDCGEIASRTDLVICYWDDAAMRGAGTKGELTIAKYFGKPAFMVTSIPITDIPGWVLGCITRTFSSFDQLKVFLSAKN